MTQDSVKADPDHLTISYSCPEEGVFTGYASGQGILLTIERASIDEWLLFCTTAIRQSTGVVLMKFGNRTTPMHKHFVEQIREGKLNEKDIKIK